MLRNSCCHSWCTYSARGENSPPRSSEDIRGLLPAAAHKTHAAAISHLPLAEGLPRGLLMGPPPAKQACCRKLRFHMYCLNGCLTSVHSRPPLKAPPWRMAREGARLTSAGSVSRLARPRWSTMTCIWPSTDSIGTFWLPWSSFAAPGANLVIRRAQLHIPDRGCITHACICQFLP